MAGTNGLPKFRQSQTTKNQRLQRAAATLEGALQRAAATLQRTAAIFYQSAITTPTPHTVGQH
jgi:hypothetical protein